MIKLKKLQYCEKLSPECDISHPSPSNATECIIEKFIYALTIVNNIGGLV